MATLNEIAYNIRNVITGGVSPDDTDVSLRQIKFMVHYHRANLLMKYTDNGRKTSNVCYQVDEMNPKSNGVIIKDFVGFNDNKAIRSIAYKDDSSADSSYVPLPIVQNHDRMFVNNSRFIKSAGSKIATLSDRKLYIWEGDSLVSGGVVEINAIFSNPTDVSSYVDDDLTQYPIPEELIPMVVQNVLQLEFNVMLGLNAKGPNNQTDEAKAKGKKKPRQKVQK
tara:strand:+ start:10570 stop:11238 length:669 start_codon:yes stop_codon:yes gene_type:complete